MVIWPNRSPSAWVYSTMSLAGDGDSGAVPVDDVDHVVQIVDGEDNGGKGHGGDPRQGGGTKDTANNPLCGAEEEGNKIFLHGCCHTGSLKMVGKE